MAKERTEAAIRAALNLQTRGGPISVVELAARAKCSRSTLYRSAAFQAFSKATERPAASEGSARTRETMTKLRGTITVLANCVQALSMRLEQQDRELSLLRDRSDDNIRPFPRGRPSIGH